MEGFATGFAARRATKPGHTAAAAGWRVAFQGVMCNEVANIPVEISFFSSSL